MGAAFSTLLISPEEIVSPTPRVDRTRARDNTSKMDFSMWSGRVISNGEFLEKIGFPLNKE